MEFAIPGFIEKFCTPNALLTLKEYLMDYAGPETKAEGEKIIREQLAKIENPKTRQQVAERLQRIENKERDLYF